MAQQLTVIAPENGLPSYKIPKFDRRKFSQRRNELVVRAHEKNLPNRFSSLEHMWVVYTTNSGKHFDGIVKSDENTHGPIAGFRTLEIRLKDFSGGGFPSTYRHLF